MSLLRLIIWIWKEYDETNITMIVIEQNKQSLKIYIHIYTEFERSSTFATELNIEKFLVFIMYLMRFASFWASHLLTTTTTTTSPQTTHRQLEWLYMMVNHHIIQFSFYLLIIIIIIIIINTVSISIVVVDVVLIGERTMVCALCPLTLNEHIFGFLQRWMN